MNLAQFLEHWAIIENPFRGEEARTDAIFARMGIAGRTTPDEGGPGRVRLVRPSTPSIHSEFDKILGELDRPSTSIVFGEKGYEFSATLEDIEAWLDEEEAKLHSTKE